MVWDYTYGKKYRTANKNKIKNYMTAYYEKNREHMTIKLDLSVFFMKPIFSTKLK